MNNCTFNGCTFEFKGTAYEIEDTNFGDSAPMVNVSTAADPRNKYEAGILDGTCSWTLKGVNAIEVGTKGAAQVKSPKGTVIRDFGTCIVESSNVSGSRDGTFTSSISLKETETLLDPWESGA